MLQKYSIYIEWNELNGIKQFSSLCLELYFVFNSESQKFSLISCIACRLILPNLICASVIRLCRLLLLPRWSLSWLSVLKHWWSKQMKSQDFLFNREIDAWHSFTISTDSETVTVSSVTSCQCLVWLPGFFTKWEVWFFPEVIFVMNILYFPIQVIQTD